MYEPGRGLPNKFADELRRVATAVNRPNVPAIVLQERNAVPSKLFDGLTVLADGTNWNPGSGQGVYTYYNSAWNLLG